MQSLTSNVLTFNSGWNGAVAIEKYLGGLVEWTNANSGLESHTILRTTDTDITISGIVKDLVALDNVDVILGCNRQMDDCEALHNTIRTLAANRSFRWKTHGKARRRSGDLDGLLFQSVPGGGCGRCQLLPVRPQEAAEAAGDPGSGMPTASAGRPSPKLYGTMTISGLNVIATTDKRTNTYKVKA